jgi:putative transposase
MPRRPRLPVTELPIHVVQRGHDRADCFFTERDYAAYLNALRDACVYCSVQVHAYVLMTNHVHLLVTPFVPNAVSRVLQSVGARYVRYINDTRGRSGTLWEGRYRACLVSDDRYVLAACRYIDLNPVRAGIVTDPPAYRWSSYGVLAGHRSDPWLVPHPTLLQLGKVPGTAYAAWCASAIADDELARIRDATRRERPFGDDAFRRRWEASTEYDGSDPNMTGLTPNQVSNSGP